MAATEASVGIPAAAETSDASLECILDEFGLLRYGHSRRLGKIDQLQTKASEYQSKLEAAAPYDVLNGRDEETAIAAFSLWYANQRLERRVANDAALVERDRGRLEARVHELAEVRRFVVAQALQPELHLLKEINGGNRYEEARGLLCFAKFTPDNGGLLRFGNLWRTFDAAPLVDPESGALLFDFKLEPVK